ncbi:MAG: hypothetical protein QM756_38600 [Polyangiaceae bacterium]
MEGECQANFCDGVRSFAYLDCTAYPGCETPIDMPENCGGCGVHAVTAANTSADCTCGGACDVSMCQIGFGNCDHEQPDCETAYTVGSPSCMPSEHARSCTQVDAVLWSGAAFAADGAYYLMGWYGATVDLDPSEGTDIRTPASFVGENFLSKFDATGKYLWSRILPGPSALRPQALTMTASGELAFLSNTDSGRSVGMLSAEGELRWLHTFAANVPAGSGGAMRAMTTDASGSLYVAGEFIGELDLDPGPGTLTVASEQSAGFVASFNAAGELRWGRALSSGTDCTSSVSDLAVHGSQLVSVGYLRGTCSFAQSTSNETQLVAGASGAAFIELSDVDGYPGRALFLNSNEFSGVGGPPTQAGSVVVGADAIYVGGSFSGQVDFDPGPGVSLRGSAGPRPFVLKLTSDGAFAWVRSLHGGAGLTLAPDGGVVAIGAAFEPTVTAQGVSWRDGPFSVTALNVDGSPAWTFDPHMGSTVRVVASTSEQFMLAGDYDGDCASPVVRFTWPR